MDSVSDNITCAPFTSSTEHLIAELERLDILLRAHLSRTRRSGRPADPYRGLYIPEMEIDELTGQSPDPRPWATMLPIERRDALRRTEQAISDRRAVTYICGGSVRLCELQRLFRLEARDLDIVVLAAAAELEPHFETLFAALQDDVTKRRPSVELALNLLCGSLVDKLATRARFDPRAPLLRWGLIALDEHASSPAASLAGRQLRLDPRILGYLLDGNESDARIGAELCRPGPEADAVVLVGAAFDESLGRAVQLCQAGRRLVLHLYGPRGAGKRSWATALCGRLGRGLLMVDGAALAAAHSGERFGEPATACLREAMLQDAALLWRGIDALLAEERRVELGLLVELLSRHEDLVILAGMNEPNAASGIDRPGVLPIEIAMPSADERAQIWRSRLGDDAAPAVVAALPALAAQFHLTPGGIAAAAAAAHTLAQWRCEDEPRLTPDDLFAGCRRQASPALGERARKIKPKQRWGDLVLPADALRQLREMCDRVRYQADVMERWGFGPKLSLGKGLAALFAGPTGTGKTMAAEIIATELALDLYKIDLSAVVSKYIGETEKNLSRIFTEAEAAHAILFFDEADALFGKRSEVKDAHDRYANVETSYLLQRMEEYEGVSILATNLRRNMDEAFTRRLAFLIAFPLPEAPDRLRIWQGAFPSLVPLSDDIDFSFLAERFKFAGGNIRNVVLAAAFLAAAEETTVAMRHLLHATRRELQKLGKNTAAEQFGVYARLVEG